MISLPELRAKALRRYPSVLRAHLAGEVVFPLPIPTNKALNRTQGIEAIYAQQAELLAHSRNKTGRGYQLDFKPNAKTGQSEIKRISFASEADFLDFTNKTDEFVQFVAHAARTADALPELLPLLLKTPQLLVEQATDWPDLLTVCAYFRQNPQPNQYVRSLPLALPTKFIERHQAALRPLLNHLIPEYVRNDEDDFFRRFHLLLEEPGIKIRFLDAALRLHPAVSQLSVWVSEFRQLNLPCQRVFIVENLTTFLSLPAVEGGLAIWGGGFAVGLLADAEWLEQKELFYWGDIDVHGFQILAQIRAHYPGIRSLLMDAATLSRFAPARSDAKFIAHPLNHLTPEEQGLYQSLLRSNARLEQEQLPASYVEAAIRRMVTAS